jgi:hypothetical protein
MLTACDPGHRYHNVVDRMTSASQGDARRTSRLAGYGKRGKIRVNPKVPKVYKGIVVRSRLVTHEKVERKLRLRDGLTYIKAHAAALKAEHKGLTQHQISVYEGLLGSIARHYPHMPAKKKRR